VEPRDGGPDHDVPPELAALYVDVWASLANRLGRDPTGDEVQAEIAAARGAGLL
jgi:hypothetical protein